MQVRLDSLWHRLNALCPLLEMLGNSRNNPDKLPRYEANLSFHLFQPELVFCVNRRLILKHLTLGKHGFLALSKRVPLVYFNQNIEFYFFFF